MGSTDGTVIGVTKILDNGADADLCNIVLVAEGFTAAEQATFTSLCNDFVAALEAEYWYPILRGGLNVHRLDVHSDESGTDDPTDCGGDGATAATYFDAHFCNGGIRRCLSGDEGLVRDELDARLPQWHVGAVLVNTTGHGGCASGNVFFASVKSGWENVALHELGHAAFGLADEYHYWEGCDEEEPERDNYTGTEPSQPNVTTVTNPANLKWRHLLSPGVPVPTMINPDCSECDDRANVLDSDTKIGLYEGAKYHHCGAFRPAYTCRMRSNGQDFCRVCAEAIAIDLGDFADAAPDLEVTPTVLQFGEVAYALTLYLSFEVRNNRSGHPMPLDVTLTPPSGGFTFAPGTELSFTLPAPLFESYTSRTVYAAFTASPVDGPSFLGGVAVTAGDPGAEQEAAVSLLGTAVPPPPVDSVLVLDRSGSMSDPSGAFGLEKIDVAIEAAELYVDLLKENDEIGIVRYNDSSDASDILLSMRVAGDLESGTGRQAARTQLDRTNLNPDGDTSIGAGIINGSSVLDGASADSRALVVLTDGRQNTNPDIPDARDEVETKTPAQRVFAVGLGLNQLEDKLHDIASVTGGVAQVTGELVDEREFLLQKLYVQILSDMSDEAFVRDPVHHLRPGECASTPVYLSEIDVSCDFIVTWRPAAAYPKYLRAWLEAPDGTIIDAAAAVTMPNVDHVVRTNHLFYRVLFPLRPDAPLGHAGRWRVWVEVFPVSAVQSNSTLVYSVMAKARSNFLLPGYLQQQSYTPGSEMTITLQPTLFGQAVTLDPPVQAKVTRPDGVVRTVDLSPAGDSGHVGVYADTPLVGPYQVDCEVSATSPAGHRVTRFRHLGGLILRPGRDRDGGGRNGDGDWHSGGGGHGPCGPDEKLCREAWRALRIQAEVLRRCCDWPTNRG